MDKEFFVPEAESGTEKTKEKVTEKISEKKVKESNDRKEEFADHAFYTGFLAGIAVMVVTVLIFMVIQKPLIITFSPFDHNPLTREQTVDYLGKTMGMIETIHERSILNDDPDEVLLSGMYKGLMAILNDRYSIYYTAEEYEDIRNSSNGQYTGLGVSIASDYVITEVFKNAPADRAGVLPGDQVIAINGKKTEELSSAEFRNEIGDETGRIVTLTVVRAGEAEPMELEVEIQYVITESVTWKELEEGIYYIRIEHFSNNTSGQFTEAWKAINEKENLTGLILDLRDNPGGGLDPTIAIAQTLVPEGLITYMEEKTGNRIEYFSKGEGCPVPMTVLINSKSASASELLSGALQDTETALLVGEHSFGKGIVQTTFSMKDGSAYKMTTAMYYTPNGTNFQDVGLTPDVEVSLTEEEMEDPQRDRTTDSQAQKALEVLKEEINKSK